MKNFRNAVFLPFVLLGALLLPVSVFAHSFGVVLISPQSGELSQSGLSFRNGFMLATTQRDSHPNEESDGHLGGLDVYVSFVDATGDVNRAVLETIEQTDIDIVLSYGLAPDDILQLNTVLAQSNAVFLMPANLSGQSRNEAGEAAFRTDFETMFGYQAEQSAVLGYNAAQRIERAVRAQGRVDDRGALRKSFAQSASDFAW